MPPRGANAHRNDNERPQPVDPLNETVSHAEFRVAFQALAQAVTVNVWSNNQAAIANQQGGAVATVRTHDFMRMNLPEFYGSKAGEDLQLYLEEASMNKFIIGISGLVLKGCKTAMLHRDMDLPRLMMHAQQIEANKIRENDRVRGNTRARFEQHVYSQPRFYEGNHPQFQRRPSIPAPSSASALAPRGRQEQGNNAPAPVSRLAHAQGASSSTAGGQRQNRFYALPFS
ncbi:uncharacterized protein LOC107841700 [Capsicum annuum]|uniref:uncharacterized protein LOC107841700 n=1 Tax=Capsicum annuum TaxID=4072 RepID=UPI001FB0FCEA|nr:uncharacterized protein LOC107841700 [Capsicum annuum]